MVNIRQIYGKQSIKLAVERGIMRTVDHFKKRRWHFAVGGIAAALCLAPVATAHAKVTIEKPKQAIYLNSKDADESVKQAELYYYIGLSDGDAIREDTIRSDNELVSGEVRCYKPVNMEGVILNVSPASPGTANISFEDGAGREYTVTAEALPYENPIQSLKITNVKNGKNLAGKLDGARAYTQEMFTFSQKTDKPKLKVVCKEGWRLGYVRIDTPSDWYSVRIFAPTGSKTLKLEKAAKGDYVWLSNLMFINEENGGYQMVEDFGRRPSDMK